jgi:hypothetical protein
VKFGPRASILTSLRSTLQRSYQPPVYPEYSASKMVPVSKF